MRKFLAAAVAGVMIFGAVNIAGADESVQTEEFSVAPKKLDKKKFKPITFNNVITTQIDESLGQPPSATRTILDLPKQFKINTKALPTCKVDPGTLGTATTRDEARDLCGKKSQMSVDKGSTANVTVATGPGTNTVIDVEVAGFNAEGKQLYLFSKPIGPASGIPASILIGKLVKSDGGKSYKQALDVTIPPLVAGAISRFEVTSTKTKYITANCKSKTMKAQAETFFSNGPNASVIDDATFKCKQKKAKKKKKGKKKK